MTDDARTYAEAVGDLADALCATWRACGVPGRNLPEALSYALELAARALLDDDPVTAELLAIYGGEVDQNLATALLVAHRPGSWEAAHVVGLTFPVDLLPPPTRASSPRHRAPGATLER
jgi:hypothetical protein